MKSRSKDAPLARAGVGRDRRARGDKRRPISLSRRSPFAWSSMLFPISRCELHHELELPLSCILDHRRPTPTDSISQSASLKSSIFVHTAPHRRPPRLRRRRLRLRRHRDRRRRRHRRGDGRRRVSSAAAAAARAASASSLTLRAHAHRAVRGVGLRARRAARCSGVAQRPEERRGDLRLFARTIRRRRRAPRRSSLDEAGEIARAGIASSAAPSMPGGAPAAARSALRRRWRAIL